MFPSSPLNLPNLDITDSMATAGAVAGNPMGMVAYLNALAAEVKALETALLGGTWSNVPTGTIVPYAGVSAPVGYLICDGSTQSRSTYAGLWTALSIVTTGVTAANSNIVAAIGNTAGMEVNHPITHPNLPTGTFITSIDSASQIHVNNNATVAGSGTVVVAPWGLGDGSTTFNLPDGRGRVLCGRGSGTGLTARWLGGQWGEENHVLATTELAAHNHPITDPKHGHTVTDPGHIHGVNDPTHYHVIPNQGGIGTAGGPQSTWAATGTNNSTAYSATGISIASHATGVTIVTGLTNISVQNAGGGLGHNNIQPMAAINHIIRT